ncbi:MAG: peptide/nickel transport system ATP-binding protein [Rhodospirillaceae bacterium]|nr:peptide/nickel transport system ATP-binding protein [Rhodospirillaceae bacterium]
MSALLEIRDLVVRFEMGGALSRLVKGDRETIEAVAGVSLSVAPGETMALVGESGSGKTTLARAIAGLVAPWSGEIRFEGRQISGLSGRQRKRLRREISMIFQDPVGSLSPRFTVRRLLAEPFRIHGLTDRDLDAEVDRLLGLVGLPRAMADRHPHQLSGGQARRVGVARAIALSPKLVIADEPTAGLDVSVQGEVLNLLNDLRETLGLSMLIITHNLHVVRHVADRMAIMYLGRFVEQGETQPIFEAPLHPYGLALLAANPEPDPDARPLRISLEGEVPSLLARPSGCEFHGRCPFMRERCRDESPKPTVAADGRIFTCHYPLDAAGASL